MASTDSITTNATEGLPRRKAIQGIAAGSLAGIAALGAVNASAKKKKKKPKSSSGTLVKFQTGAKTQAVAVTLIGDPPTAVTATCPAAASGEVAFATGGGFTIATPEDNIFPIDTNITSDGKGWTTRFVNNDVAPESVTVNVVCAYFKA